jgi:hypothetical protein
MAEWQRKLATIMEFAGAGKGSGGAGWNSPHWDGIRWHRPERYLRW